MTKIGISQFKIIMKNIFEKINFYKVVACLTVVVGSILIAYGAYFSSNKFYREAEIKYNFENYFGPTLKMQARMIANQIEDQMGKIASVLKTAVEYRRFQNISSSCSAENEEALKTVELALGDVADFVALINKNGIMVCISEGLAGMKGKDISSQPQVQQAIATKKMVVSRMFVNPMGIKIVVLEAPIFSDEGNFVGLLGAAIRAENIEKIFADTPFLLPSSYVAIFDDNGAIIYHPNSDFVLEDVFGEKIQTAINQNTDTNNLFKNMLAAKSGYMRYLYQREKAAGYAPVKIIDNQRFWAVAVTVVTDELEQATGLLYLKNQAINFAIIFIGVLAVLWLAIYLWSFSRERERGGGRREGIEKRGKGKE